MKKMVASVGLVALGASGLQAAQDNMGVPSDTGRFWSVSATARGFYDDNINTIPNSASLPPGYSRGSAGYEISPALFLSVPLEQTTIGLSFIYSFKYYENKPVGQSEFYDMTYVLNAALNHAFSERYQISVKDSFVIGQEPDILRAGNTYNTFQRIPGDNTRNYGVINFEAQITRLFGLEVGYANTLYNYAASAWLIGPGGFISASNAGLLNEMDNTVHLDGRFQIQPQTIGVIGYQFRAVNYTAGQPIGGSIFVPGSLVMSDARNLYGHYGYIGLDHNFRPDLTASFRAGGNYNDYYNSHGQNNLAPYALVSLRYTYLPESYLEVGYTYDFNSSINYSTFNQPGNLTLGAYSSSVYATLHHRITPKLHGTVFGQYQNNLYYGGSFNNDNQQYWVLGLQLEYQFNRYFSAQIGYDYDNVGGDIPNQNYDRNRVYAGVTASY
jgi:hypothetical protein